MAKSLAPRAISGSNIWTDRVQLAGYFNISISGVWEGTITCQRSFDQGSTWHDVQAFDKSVEEYGFEPEGGVWYQAGFKDTEWSSGTCVVRLSQ